MYGQVRSVELVLPYLILDIEFHLLPLQIHVATSVLVRRKAVPLECMAADLQVGDQLITWGIFPGSLSKALTKVLPHDKVVACHRSFPSVIRTSPF